VYPDTSILLVLLGLCLFIVSVEQHFDLVLEVGLIFVVVLFI